MEACPLNLAPRACLGSCISLCMEGRRGWGFAQVSMGVQVLQLLTFKSRIPQCPGPLLPGLPHLDYCAQAPCVQGMVPVPGLPGHLCA